MKLDPALNNFLPHQPVIELPRLLDELKSKPDQPSFLQMAKSVIGKDINQPIPMPVEMCEPSVDLMKRAEDIEYSDLLNEAAKLPKGSIERLLKVASFALSPYSSLHTERIGKPLFVVPGETLEAVYPNKGVRYIAEAFIDHGWGIAGCMEGRSWRLSTDDQMKTKFGANSAEFHPHWFLELTFDDGDIYTWKKVLTTANQTVTMPIFISHTGKLVVKQPLSNREAVIAFGPISLTTVTTKAKKAANRILTGSVKEGGKTLESLKLTGFWDSHLDVIQDKGAPTRLWTKNPHPEEMNRFQMPSFVVGLSKPPVVITSKLPPTDTRNRKDYGLVERGQWAEAAKEKARMEEIGFAKAAKAKETENVLQPRWFLPDPARASTAPGEGIRWRYNHKYWAAKEDSFANLNLPKLFE